MFKERDIRLALSSSFIRPRAVSLMINKKNIEVLKGLVQAITQVDHNCLMTPSNSMFDLD